MLRLWTRWRRTRGIELLPDVSGSQMNVGGGRIDVIVAQKRLHNGQVCRPRRGQCRTCGAAHVPERPEESQLMALYEYRMAEWESTAFAESGAADGQGVVCAV